MRDSELIRRWIDLISQLSFPAVKVGFGFELGRGGGAEGGNMLCGELGAVGEALYSSQLLYNVRHSSLYIASRNGRQPCS